MNVKKKKYVQMVEEKFIRKIIEPWHKRNHKLLHIGHHSTIEPSYFWDMGFDVTYLAANQECLEKAKEKNGKKIEYYLAQSDHLPFDEKVFDFIYLAHTFSRPEYNNEQKKRILEELLRVTAQGLCLVEYNSLAFSRLKPAFSALEFANFSQYLPYKSEAQMYAALSLPSFLWSSNFICKAINITPMTIPFGSLMAMRIDLSPVNLTPLTLKVQERASDFSA